LLARHVAQARRVVRLLLDGRLVCQPFGTEKGYAFTVTGTYGRLGVPVESVNVGGGPNGIRAVVELDLTFSIRGVAIRH
jgi:hypothetical protein